MNILITSAGRRVSLVKAFQKELKIYYPKGKVFATDAIPKLAPACIIADKCFKVPKLESEDYINFLIRECQKHVIRLIIPTIDTELMILAKNKELLLSKGIIPIISSLEFVNKCRDKRVIHEFFLTKNINIAKEYTIDNLKFPLFIKPSDGSRSIDTFYIKSEQDLTDYHFKNDKFMFLEYIDHDSYDEYTCDLYYDKVSELKCVVPRKRIETRDGEVSKGKTSKNELVYYIKKHLKTIEGAHGCLTSQFFFNNNTKRIVGIEINPRFGGGFPLTYLAGGNYPRWIIEEYLLNKKISYFDQWENNLLMLRYDNEIIVHNYDE